VRCHQLIIMFTHETSVSTSRWVGDLFVVKVVCSLFVFCRKRLIRGYVSNGGPFALLSL